MTTFYLEHKDDGKIDLVRTDPVVIGTFTDEANARNVLDLVVGQALEQTPVEPRKMSDFLKPVDDSDAPKPAKALPPKPKPTPKPKPKVAAKSAPKTAQPAKKSVLPVPIAKKTEMTLSEDDLNVAFDRIRNGEKIAMIAQDIGVPMMSLRAKWANHNRYLNATVNPDPQIQCACGRDFTPSGINNTMCARCARG